MSKKTRKRILNALFIAAVFGITCFTVFHDKNLNELENWLARADALALLPCLFLVPLFVACESFLIWYLYRKVGVRARPGQCLRYSFIGFFFSCITPSATGGQPAQLMEMGKDRHELSLSSLILLLITIGYKFVLVCIGVFCLLFAHRWLFDFLGGVSFFFYLGIALNVLAVSGMLFLVFKENLAASLLRRLFDFLEWLHLLRNKDKLLSKLEESFETYHKAAGFIGKNPGILAVLFVVSFIQRLFMFCITYFVYLSFHLRGSGAVTVILLQAVISLSVDMLPLPGGMGASENLFLIIFEPIFGEALVLPGMLLSRGISFYLLLFMSAVITMASYLFRRRTAERKH